MLKVKNDASKYVRRAHIGNAGAAVTTKPTAKQAAKHQKEIVKRIAASGSLYVDLRPKRG